MNKEKYLKLWKQEEEQAHINGWDFSHLRGRYETEKDLPWNYESIVRSCLSNDKRILDYDTGGGEFLLSLNHPNNMTSATEGYKPNVALCKNKLLPMGIDFRECADCKCIPFEDSSFDIIINRHGEFDAKEIHRLLKKGGVFITEQVGGNNERDLVNLVLPNASNPFADMNLSTQQAKFESSEFDIIKAEEAYGAIKFYDVGAFVWFARVIEWEFEGFSVDKCYDKLLNMQQIIDTQGVIKGTTHRYLIVAKKI